MGAERPLYLEVRVTQKEVQIINSLKSVRTMQARNINEYEKIISWYENMTGITRDEIKTTKIEGTDWEAYREGKNDKKI